MMGTAPTVFTIGRAIGFLYKDMWNSRLAAALLLLTCAAQGLAGEFQPNGDFRLCDNATQSPAEAISACTRILNLKPAGRDFSLAWSNRGAAWFTQGNLDRAISDFTEAIKTNPKLIIAYKNRAAAWLSKNEFDRAINDYTTVIRLDPKSAAAYIDRANALAKKGDLDRAIADLDKAIELAPEVAGRVFDPRSTFAKPEQFRWPSGHHRGITARTG